MRTVIALAAVSGLAVTGTLPAQERPAIVESVDLAVPFPPTIVQTAGKPIAVYELHVTNFIAVDVALTRLQVVRSDGASIADFRDGNLRTRLGRPGMRRGHERPHVVGPGLRAVAYLWIELPDGLSAPPLLRHRVEMDILHAAGTVHAAVEGASSPVSRTGPVVLDPPLRGGPWTAVYDPLLIGGHRTTIYTIDGRARIPGRFAIDWIRLPPSGTIEKDVKPRPADWNGNGAEVLAVADAVVVSAMDDMPDNTDPPAATAPRITPGNASGNYVALDLGEGRFAFYEHLQHGSVTVRTGARVKRGEVIGRLGNSGSSSIGPHLHFHVSDANSLLGAEGLPFVFRRFAQLGAFESIEALIGGRRWLAGPGGKADVRTLERPAANAVVRFP